MRLQALACALLVAACSPLAGHLPAKGSATAGSPGPASLQAFVPVAERFVEQHRGLKFKQKVKYRRRTGHRQHLTRLRIDSISADGKTVKAEPPEPAAKRKAARPKAAAAAPAGEKPARRRAAKAESTATANANAEAAPASRRARERGAPKAQATQAPEKAPSPARPKRTKASGEVASTADADEKASSAAETKPRARRTTKARTESAKEE